MEYNTASKKDVLRFDTAFKAGHQWKTKEVTYKILSFTATLKTPVCDYKNLMTIDAVYPTITYVFYDLKGFGYVGATAGGKLISCTVPKLEILKEYRKD